MVSEYKYVADIIVALMAIAAVIISLWGIKHTRASMLLAFYEQGDSERFKYIRSKLYAYSTAEIESIVEETKQLKISSDKKPDYELALIISFYETWGKLTKCTFCHLVLSMEWVQIF